MAFLSLLCFSTPNQFVNQTQRLSCSPRMCQCPPGWTKTFPVIAPQHLASGQTWLSESSFFLLSSHRIQRVGFNLRGGNAAARLLCPVGSSSFCTGIWSHQNTSCIPSSSAVSSPGPFPCFWAQPRAHFNGEGFLSCWKWVDFSRLHPDTCPLVFLTPPYSCRVPGAPEMLLKELQRGFYLTLRAGQGVRECTFGWAFPSSPPLCWRNAGSTEFAAE